MNMIGDIRLCHPERDKGKRPRDITDFEVWMGDRWVHAREAESIRFQVQVPSSG